MRSAAAGSRWISLRVVEFARAAVSTSSWTARASRSSVKRPPCCDCKQGTTFALFRHVAGDVLPATDCIGRFCNFSLSPRWCVANTNKARESKAAQRGPALRLDLQTISRGYGLIWRCSMSKQDIRAQHSGRDLVRAQIDVPPTPPDPNRPPPIPKTPPAPPTPTDEPPPEPVEDPPAESEPKPPYTVEQTR